MVAAAATVTEWQEQMVEAVAARGRRLRAGLHRKFGEDKWQHQRGNNGLHLMLRSGEGERLHRYPHGI